ncbi:MAG: DNA polymerase/3'-5' exonuclease PolX [Acidobacteria bacterium]|nr:MAG: DNA polymerase/3'-5' exonuclease PolX [Acidobacteriota bacterium]
MTTRSDQIRMLVELTKLTALDEGSPQAFKVRAYENAIAGIEGHHGELSGLTKAELTEIKGVGSSTADKILELEATGTVAKLETLREMYPPAFVALTKIPGLGPKTLKMLRSQLGIEDIGSLKEAVDAEQLRELPGLGEKSEQKIARAIDRLGLHGKDRRTPLVEVLGFANSLAQRIAEIEGVVEAVPCGSIRRFSETVGDVDIVVATTNPGLVGDVVLGYPEVSEVVGAGKTKISFLTREELQVDIRTVRPDQLGSALLYFTGSKAHNIALRQKAIDRGWLLSEYGLFEDKEVLASETEGEIYEALGMQAVPPMLREGSGEVEAASNERLPNLIERSDIKGDLHYHSDRSGDGRSSLEEMVEAAIGAGWEYVAFTDHGEDLAINGSTPDQMLAHRDQIRGLDSRYPEIRLLFGCELNIGRDGDLDYDSDFRLEFDYCVASIHSHFDMSSDRQTARILTALQDPAVNAIGHLTGRYVGRRPGVELDIGVVLEALALSGVALEINGALDRLDATSEVARQAMSVGVDVVIDTDSHHTRDLVRMDYGVRYARRGWVTANRVLNARTLDGVLASVAARRAR